MNEALVPLALATAAHVLVRSEMIPDDKKLTSAIAAVAKNHFGRELSPPKRRSENSRLEYIRKMIENAKKNKQKVKVLKEKLDLAQEKLLQPAPNIDEMSKKMCRGDRPDVVKRAQIDFDKRCEKIRAFREMKEKKENEEFRKNCSFSPFLRNKSTRNHEEVVKDLYDWKLKVEEKLTKKKAEKDSEELSQMYPVPKISKSPLPSKRSNFFQPSPQESKSNPILFSSKTSKKLSNLQDFSKSLPFSPSRLKFQDPRPSPLKSSNPITKNLLSNPLELSSKYSYEEIVKLLSNSSSFN